MDLFPWLRPDYHNLTTNFSKHSFTALLVYGAANSGQQQLVNKFLQYILCLTPLENEACENCGACRLYQENNHPDLFILAAVQSEERKLNQIKVEQVRQVIEFASRSPHVSTVKVIYLPDVLELNLNSANALLKILEEPPPGCIFILQAANINRILPTIKSRCFKYKLTVPSYEEALLYVAKLENHEFWLTYFEGEPFFEPPFDNEQLLILQKGLLKPSIETLFELSRELDPKKIGSGVLFDFMLKWLSDLLIVAQSGNARYFYQHQALLTGLVKRLNLDKLFNLQDDLVFLSAWRDHPLNHKLQFENILFKYQQLYA